MATGATATKVQLHNNKPNKKNTHTIGRLELSVSENMSHGEGHRKGMKQYLLVCMCVCVVWFARFRTHLHGGAHINAI